MRRAIVFVAVGWLFLTLVGVQGAYGQECRALPYTPKRHEASKPVFRLYIFAFDGPGQFGLNVRWLFDLQLWSTFRKLDPRIPNSDFGVGLVDGCVKSLPDVSFKTANEASMRLGESVQLLLWGKASHFADGDVVEAYLSIPEQPPGSADTSRHIWTLDFPTKGPPVSISLDVPTRRVIFRPIVLRKGVVDRMASSASGKIYKDRTLTEVVAEPADGWWVARSYESDGIWLRSPEGWLPIPSLSNDKSEIVTFTGAVMQVLRGDWNAALAGFHTVLGDTHLPIETRVDALIFAGLAEERSGRSGRLNFEEAERVNPLSRVTASFLIMSALADLKSNAAVGPAGTVNTQDKLARLHELIDKKRPLFEERDAWFQRAVQIAADGFHQDGGDEQR